MENNNLMKLVLDFEFNGLPKFGYVPTITEIKGMFFSSKNKLMKAFSYINNDGARPSQVGALLKTGHQENNCSQEQFNKRFTQILKTFTKKSYCEDRFLIVETQNIYMFSKKTDLRVLKENYGIILKGVVDLQEMLMLSQYEKAMAFNGRSLEICNYLLTGETFSSSHSGVEELDPLKNIFDFVMSDKIKKKERLTVYPWGDDAGTPLEDFCEAYRRRADGYRFNNSDVLAYSLDMIIDHEEEEEDDEDEWL